MKSLFTVFLFLFLFMGICNEASNKKNSNSYKSKRISNITPKQTYKSYQDTGFVLYDMNLLDTEGNVKSVSISFYSASGEKMGNDDILELTKIDYDMKENILLEFKRTYKQNEKNQLTEIKKYYYDNTIKAVKFKYDKNGRIKERIQDFVEFIDTSYQKKGFKPLTLGGFVKPRDMPFNDTVLTTTYFYDRDKLIKIINPYSKEIILYNYFSNMLDILYIIRDVTYIYNKNNKVSEMVFTSQGNNKLIFKIEYDKNGNIIKKYSESEDSLFYGIVYYEYYNNNKLKSIYSERYWSEGYNYDSLGNLISEFHDYEASPVYTYYVYDDNNNVVAEIGEWPNYHIFTEYNHFNKKIKEYYFLHDEVIYLSKDLYTYNTKGELISMKILEYEDKSDSYDVDLFGKVKVIDEYKINDEYKVVGIEGLDFPLSHDDKVEVSSSKFVFNENISPDSVFEYLYEYDSFGNWVKQTIYKNNELLCTLKREIHYF